MKTARLLLLTLLVAPVIAFAQEGNSELPSAGLTPASPFYFLEQLVEGIQSFLTFNPSGKAKLQIRFAGERVSEIKVMLKAKGVNAKGLGKAQARLQGHLAKAKAIVAKQKKKGEDVSDLEAEIASDLEETQSELSLSFKDQKKELQAKRKDLKKQLKDAQKAGEDTASLEAELNQVEEELVLLKQKRKDFKLKDDEDEDINGTDSGTGSTTDSGTGTTTGTGSTEGKAKITICHVPDGNPENAHTITIGEPAWSAHETHGDTLGACGDGESGTGSGVESADGEGEKNNKGKKAENMQKGKKKDKGEGDDEDEDEEYEDEDEGTGTGDTSV